ncbi:hypothetical protein RR46_05623 [Papilio xuthus]|uniref:Uncharacterized protein n=1 Tax=Papilio xuthus TaxID=66420 RepID=A0A194PUB8_PAPXU|nr:hypothetical protein RR46_05623 [Papilio xuthus]
MPSAFDLRHSATPFSAQTFKRTLYLSELRPMWVEFQDLGVHDTMLLNLVRQQSSEMRESQDQTIELPREHQNDSDSETNEPCNHGLSIRMTDRSVSRSRFSRVSTRRDMDIPSILAHTANISAPCSAAFVFGN